MLTITADCVWNEWELGVCSVTCGGGTRIDKRTKSSEATHGGLECKETKEDTRSVACNTKVCPRKHIENMCFGCLLRFY